MRQLLVDSLQKQKGHFNLCVVAGVVG